MLFDNLKDFYPDVDYENLPDGYMKFIDNDDYEVGIYEVYEKSRNVIDGNVVRLVHVVRPMTEEEKNKKIMDEKNKGCQFASWSWSDETCSFEPPVPMPIEDFLSKKSKEPDIQIRWNESLRSWEYFY